MHTILYLGSTTDLAYERELLDEWGKRDVSLASCALLAAPPQAGGDGPHESAAAFGGAAGDPLAGVDAVVVEQGRVAADELRTHPRLSAVVILDDEHAEVDVDAATAASVWVTRATNRSIVSRLARAPKTPNRSARRHALQDALACVAGERPSGRVNEL